MLFGFWGIDMGKLLTSLSIFAAALAIISKEFVASIISGIIISFSNDINIDDYVKIGNNKGKILDINLAKISLLNEDDDIIFIPNDKVYMSDIINYTRRDIKKVSIDFELDLLHLTSITSVSYTHLRAHETVLDLVCRLLLEKKKQNRSSHILIHIR